VGSKFQEQIPALPSEHPSRLALIAHFGVPALIAECTASSRVSSLKGFPRNANASL
jgi:hypothetical protein